MLAVATLVPIGVLLYFGAHILRQNRDVEIQHARANLDIAKEQFAHDVHHAVQRLGERLSRGEGIHFTANGFRSDTNTGLLYQPVTPPVPDLSVFEEVTRAELQRNDLTVAESAYRRLAASNDPSIRAEALIRLGHTMRRRGDRNGALQVFQNLVRMEAVPVAADVAALVGHQLRAKVFEEGGALEDLRRETADLAAALDRGDWLIDRATYGFYRFDLLEKRWNEPPPSRQAMARTEAAIHLWELWRRGDLAPRGSELRVEDGASVLAVWELSSAPEHPVMWLAAPDAIESLLRPLADARHVTFTMSELTGRQLIAGANAHDSISLTPVDIPLPFIMKVSSLDTADSDRRFLIAGLATALFLMIAAAYGLFRVTTREVALARQQSDFVSAVSHEFRTPLTSMRHLTHLLVSRASVGEERKSEYYELLSRETERLHRMVESLLRFGRIDAGAYAWDLQPTDAEKLARDAVEEFCREPEATGRDVACEIAAPLPPIRADREALSRALWNGEMSDTCGRSAILLRFERSSHEKRDPLCRKQSGPGGNGVIGEGFSMVQCPCALLW